MAVKVAKDPNAVTSVDSGTQPVHFIPRPRWACLVSCQSVCVHA